MSSLVSVVHKPLLRGVSQAQCSGGSTKDFVQQTLLQTSAAGNIHPCLLGLLHGLLFLNTFHVVVSTGFRDQNDPLISLHSLSHQSQRSNLISWALLGYCRSILMLWSSLKHLLLLSRISASSCRLFSCRDQGCSHWAPLCTRQNIMDWAEIASVFGRQA